tara:strand:+ start:7820 stop:9853 length:2034 start_codon:yes stop_codon:yes gene_type:complete
MLDTIRLRLYGANDIKTGTLAEIQAQNGLPRFAVPEHNELYRKILTKQGKNFTMHLTYNREIDDYEPIAEDEWMLNKNSNTVTKHYQVRDRMKFYEEGKVKDKNKAINGSYAVPSSFSDVTFRINENGGFIDFQVSIPKYLYGHSLAEFIPQTESDLKFEHGINFNSYDFQAKFIYDRLFKFIDKFFTDLCIFFSCESIPNNDYIEICRLDFCYNMYFKSKEEALRVLQEQRKIQMKLKRSSMAIEKSFDTSIWYKNEHGTAYKIYHKGSEYSSSKFGDLRKHLNINKEFIESYINRNCAPDTKKFYRENQGEIWNYFLAKGKDNHFALTPKDEERLRAVIADINEKTPYKIPFLKKEMDKVLRFEISMSNRYFMYLYKRHCFRRNDKIHQESVKRYKQAASIYANSNKQFSDVSRKDRKNYKMMHGFLNRGIALILGDNQSLKRYCTKAGSDYNHVSGEYNISRFEYRYTVLGKHDTVHFSEYFLMQCIKRFKAFVKHYTIHEIEPFEAIMDRIKEYNNNVQSNVDAYNERNRFKVVNPATGEFIRKKSGQKITKATQLLTRNELMKQGLKTVNATILGSVLTQMYHHKKSLTQVFEDLGTNKSTKSRIKADLKFFEVFDNSLSVAEPVNMKMTFEKYYWNTSGLQYAKNFYRNIKLKAEDYGKNPFDTESEFAIA